MQSPLKLTIHGVDHSEALETRIRAKVEKLEEFFDHITSCRVAVEMPHRHSPVSYTHLDVYKRQAMNQVMKFRTGWRLKPR